MVERGQSRRRFADLLIAATALAEANPLVTRNGDDFRGFEGLITVVEINDKSWTPWG
jgi:predicted nucleic acid-binding protein